MEDELRGAGYSIKEMALYNYFQGYSKESLTQEIQSYMGSEGMVKVGAGIWGCNDSEDTQ